MNDRFLGDLTNFFINNKGESAQLYDLNADSNRHAGTSDFW